MSEFHHSTTSQSSANISVCDANQGTNVSSTVFIPIQGGVLCICYHLPPQKRYQTPPALRVLPTYLHHSNLYEPLSYLVSMLQALGQKSLFYNLPVICEHIQVGLASNLRILLFLGAVLISHWNPSNSAVPPAITLHIPYSKRRVEKFVPR
ncbi:Hypothetical protein RBTH_09294 [Bacillus thuringiensis serovar israelensis ATCC 35646]|nr:Hypothetical protein RBTH_09294 [Bacillus thuringiensis serovar israelensis ATCC 35646]